MVETKFKNTDIGLIPEDWEIKELGKLTSLMTNGFVGTAKIHYTEVDTGVTYVQGFNVLENSFDYTGIKKVTLNFHRAHLRSELKYRDLLTIQTGNVGLTTFVPKELEGANCHALIISRFKSQEVIAKYVSFYLNSKTGRKRLKDIETGTTMKHINVGDFQYFQIPLPPLPEQKAIAEVLSDTDTWIESLEKLIAKKQLIKQGAMQKLLTPKEDWEVKKLSEVLTFIIGGGTPSRNIEAFWNGNIPWMTVKDFATFSPNSTQEFISTKGLEKSATRIVKAGSLIIATRIALGQIVKYNVDVAINQDLKTIGLDGSIQIDYFIHYYRSISGKIKEKGSGSTVMGLSVEDLKNIEIDIPSTFSEQTRIATILSDMDTEIETLEQKLTKAQQIKKGLMQELLTGRIRMV